MKILLDECLPLDFRHSFPGDRTPSVQWAGFPPSEDFRYTDRKGDLLITTGRRRFFVPLILVNACFAGVSADFEVKAGGTWLTLPGPISDFPEVGDKLRTTFFELLAPSSNRLLSAYVKAETLVDLNNGKGRSGLGVYAMVEVPRAAEYVDCTPQAFEKIVQGVIPNLDVGGKRLSNLEEEMNLRLKSLGGRPLDFGRPVMLGIMFKKTNAVGFAVLMELKQGDHSVTMLGGCAIVRVKQRLLFAYLYCPYKSQDTVTWLRKNLEPWANAILAKNGASKE